MQVCCLSFALQRLQLCCYAVARCSGGLLVKSLIPSISNACLSTLSRENNSCYCVTTVSLIFAERILSGTFDDVSDPFPQRSQISLIAADRSRLPASVACLINITHTEKTLSDRHFVDFCSNNNNRAIYPSHTQYSTTNTHANTRTRAHSGPCTHRWGIAWDTVLGMGWIWTTGRQKMLKVNITTWIRLGQSEISYPLFIQSQIPPHCYIVLSLK